MSEREWTKEELDDVWPLDKHGFAWGWNGRAWMASSEDCVCFPLVLDASAFRMVDDGAPLEVVLAVASVALGLDSPAAIAAAFDTEARNHRESRERYGYRPHPTDATLAEDIYTHAAAMIRRGTVKP